MRQKLYAIFQLFVLVLFIGKSVIPFVQYAVNKNYIAKNLCVNKDNPKSCCHGKCYLEKEIIKSYEVDDFLGEKVTHKSHYNEVKEFINTTLCDNLTVFEINEPPVFDQRFVKEIFLPTVFVPPKTPGYLFF